MKRRLMIVVPATVLIALVLVAVLISTREAQAGVKAYALVQIERQPPSILGGPEVKFDREEFDSYRHRQAFMVKTPKVLKAALRAPKVQTLEIVKQQQDPVAWLAKRLVVDFPDDPSVLRIGISGGGAAEELVTLVQAVTDAYLAECVDREFNKRLERLEFLKELNTKYDKALQRKQADLKALEETVSTGDAKILAQKHKFSLDELNAIQSELLQVQSELRKARLEFQAMLETAKPLAIVPVPESLIEEHLKKDKAYERCVNQVAKLENDLKIFKDSFIDYEKAQPYQRTVAELAVAQKALVACRDELRPLIVQRLRDKAFADAQLGKQAAQARIDFMQKLETVLQQEVEVRFKQAGVFQKKAVDVEWLKDEIAALHQTAKRLASQLQDLTVEIQAPRRVYLLQEATAVP
jgi:succinoglycan biosynthesis transport protein ExoP